MVSTSPNQGCGSPLRGIAVFQSSPRTDTGLIITPTFRPTRHLPPSHLQDDQRYRVLLAGEMELGLSYVAFRWQLRSRSAVSTPVLPNAQASQSRVVRAMFIGRYRAVS